MVHQSSRFAYNAYLLSLALLLYPVCSPAAQPRDIFLIVPFKDLSHFRGDWDIRRGLPLLLEELLRKNERYTVLPADTISTFLLEDEEVTSLSDDQALRIGRAARADLVVTGDIRSFSISRFTIGNPFIGGYTSYSVLVEIGVRVFRTLSRAQVGDVRGKADLTDRDLGLTLLGKRTGKDADFFGLNEIPFGSENFRATLIGKVTLQALQQIAEEIEASISAPSAIQQRNPKVLSIARDEVYLNLGLADKIEIGHKFVVYSHQDTQKVGLVQIVEVYARHLSRARILEGQDAIRTGDVLRAE